MKNLKMKKEILIEIEDPEVDAKWYSTILILQ